MPAQVTNYKCPACTGPLHFVGESGKLECEYCGSSFEVAEIEALYAEKEDKAEAAFQQAEERKVEETTKDPYESNSDWGADEGKMRAYGCPSCGAELICDDTTAATSCPYCGNPTVVPGQFSGTMKPDLILPFKLSKEDAINALKQHYKGKFLLPREFSKANHIQEMKGLYVPFWLYDTKSYGDCMFQATRSHSRREGNYKVITTEHFNVFRQGDLRFENVPADGSSKMDDNYMDSIEPYDFKELKPFSTAYLPGYLADKYDVSAQENGKRIEERCSNSLLSMLRRDVVGYETVTPVTNHVSVKQESVRYAMLPVWTLLTKWKDKNYMFMMNAQTGKLVGDLPIDKLKLIGTFAGLTAVLSGLFYFTGIGAAIASFFA